MCFSTSLTVHMSHMIAVIVRTDGKTGTYRKTGSWEMTKIEIWPQKMQLSLPEDIIVIDHVDII